MEIAKSHEILTVARAPTARQQKTALNNAHKQIETMATLFLDSAGMQVSMSETSIPVQFLKANCKSLHFSRKSDRKIRKCILWWWDVWWLHQYWQICLLYDMWLHVWLSKTQCSNMLLQRDDKLDIGENCHSHCSKVCQQEPHLHTHTNVWQKSRWHKRLSRNDQI